LFTYIYYAATKLVSIKVDVTDTTVVYTPQIHYRQDRRVHDRRVCAPHDRRKMATHNQTTTTNQP